MKEWESVGVAVSKGGRLSTQREQFLKVCMCTPVVQVRV